MALRVCLCSVALAFSCITSTLAQASIKHQIDIPPQQLGTALAMLARQTKIQVIYPTRLVEGRSIRAVSGSMTPEEALAQMLAPMGLRFEFLDAQTVTLKSTEPQSNLADPRSGAGAGEIKRVAGEPGSSFWSRLLLAQADTGRSSSAATEVSSGLSSGPADSSKAPLEEVLVTASKLQQPARTIAGSVAIVTGAQLDELGAQSFADYLTRVPGVVFNESLPGLSTATIRGISTTTSLDQGQGTTGYFVNEVPLTDPNFAVSIPDIDAFDVNNVAVMRGPQGTLFGSASLGGAINYQTALPDLNNFEARLQGTFASTAHGGDSKSGKGMVNVPLVADKLALRAVFVYRDDGGYIDNLGTGVRGSNRTLIRGGRAELLWTPTDGTRVSYLFLKQLQRTDDWGYQEPLIAGPLEKRTLIPEPFEFKTTINNLRLDQDLGFATLTATATYHQKSQVSDTDGTPIFGALFGNQLSPITGAQYAESNGTTFEVRLASPAGRRFTYLLGVMRDLTRESFLDTFGAPGAQAYATSVFDPLFGPGFGARSAPNDIFYSAVLDAKGEERALFGEGTFHFNDQWAVTLGGRLFDTQVTGFTSSSGLLEYLVTNPNVLEFAYSSRERSRGFTPKASITWNPTSDIMVYALASKGFRFGGPNLNPPDPTTPFPPNYGPDSLWNYEIGTRTNWLDRRLELDTTAFYIDWSNIQVRLSTPGGLAYATNFGRAISYGLENTALWHMLPTLSLQGSITYLDATLKQAFQSGLTTEPAGAVLPGASKWNIAATLVYELADLPLKPSILLSDRFISTAPAGFGQAAPITQGDYNLLDLRIKTVLKSIEATLFVNNIADKRGVSNASYFPGNPFQQNIVRPRTVGLTLDYRY